MTEPIIVRETASHWWVQCAADGCTNTQCQGKAIYVPNDPRDHTKGSTRRDVLAAQACWCGLHGPQLTH